MKPHYVLGINAYHGDSSAALIRDGKIVAAAEEERFLRLKHWAGFPVRSIEYCLKEAGIEIGDVDHVAINRKPNAHVLKKIVFAVSTRPSFSAIRDRLSNAVKVRDVKDELLEKMKVPASRIRARVHHVEHHRAHLASSFLVSPFESAATVSVDGFGDFVSTMWGAGSGSKIEVMDEVFFPHSLGLLYLALTQYLGFPNYGDEYKVMGLAPYGTPAETKKLGRLIRLLPGGKFELNLNYFLHHSDGVAMTWEGGSPTIGRVFSPALEELLGPSRKPEEPLTDYHKNIAASLQACYEEAFFHILDHVYQQTRNPHLCLAGGCAMNSVANGKIFEKTPFCELYIQSAAGDAGGAIGAAYYVWNTVLGHPRSFVMDHAYWGPGYREAEVDLELERNKFLLKESGCYLEKVEQPEELCQRVAQAISEGQVVGWFQGRMEWGPRALGNRSILGDPRRKDMKDILNAKIKRRESFRPFAPSIVREAVAEWFETDYDVPFMLQVYQIKNEKQAIIPAVTHVNGSGRLQTVTEAQNPLYYQLIKAFGKLTGVPIVLNTSFNENEPVVNTPREALECFLRTKMDVLVLGNYFLHRIAR